MSAPAVPDEAPLLPPWARIAVPRYYRLNDVGEYEVPVGGSIPDSERAILHPVDGGQSLSDSCLTFFISASQLVPDAVTPLDMCANASTDAKHLFLANLCLLATIYHNLPEGVVEGVPRRAMLVEVVYQIKHPSRLLPLPGVNVDNVNEGARDFAVQVGMARAYRTLIQDSDLSNHQTAPDALATVFRYANEKDSLSRKVAGYRFWLFRQCKSTEDVDDITDNHVGFDVHAEVKQDPSSGENKVVSRRIPRLKKAPKSFGNVVDEIVGKAERHSQPHVSGARQRHPEELGSLPGYIPANRITRAEVHNIFRAYNTTLGTFARSSFAKDTNAYNPRTVYSFQHSGMLAIRAGAHPAYADMNRYEQGGLITFPFGDVFYVEPGVALYPNAIMRAVFPTHIDALKLIVPDPVRSFNLEPGVDCPVSIPRSEARMLANCHTALASVDQGDPQALGEMRKHVMRASTMAMSSAGLVSTSRMKLYDYLLSYAHVNKTVHARRPRITSDLSAIGEFIVNLFNLMESGYGAGTCHSSAILHYLVALSVLSADCRTNMLVSGDSAIGKGYAAKMSKALCVPGTVHLISYLSPKAFVVPGGKLAHVCFMVQEAPHAMIGSDGNDTQNNNDTQQFYKDVLEENEIECRVKSIADSKVASGSDAHHQLPIKTDTRIAFIFHTNESGCAVAKSFASRLYLVDSGTNDRSDGRSKAQCRALAEAAVSQLRCSQRAVYYHRLQCLLALALSASYAKCLPKVTVGHVTEFVDRVITNLRNSGHAVVDGYRVARRIDQLVRELVTIEAILLVYDVQGIEELPPYDVLDVLKIAPYLCARREHAVIAVTAYSQEFVPTYEYAARVAIQRMILASSARQSEQNDYLSRTGDVACTLATVRRNQVYQTSRHAVRGPRVQSAVGGPSSARVPAVNETHTNMRVEATEKDMLEGLAKQLLVDMRVKPLSKTLVSWLKGLMDKKLLRFDGQSVIFKASAFSTLREDPVGDAIEDAIAQYPVAHRATLITLTPDPDAPHIAKHIRVAERTWDETINISDPSRRKSALAAAVSRVFSASDTGVNALDVAEARLKRQRRAAAAAAAEEEGGVTIESVDDEPDVGDDNSRSSIPGTIPFINKDIDEMTAQLHLDQLLMTEEEIKALPISPFEHIRARQRREANEREAEPRPAYGSLYDMAPDGDRVRELAAKGLAVVRGGNAAAHAVEVRHMGRRWRIAVAQEYMRHTAAQRAAREIGVEVPPLTLGSIVDQAQCDTSHVLSNIHDLFDTEGKRGVVTTAVAAESKQPRQTTIDQFATELSGNGDNVSSCSVSSSAGSGGVRLGRRGAPLRPTSSAIRSPDSAAARVRRPLSFPSASPVPSASVSSSPSFSSSSRHRHRDDIVYDEESRAPPEFGSDMALDLGFSRVALDESDLLEELGECEM
jgi:hypothetical protein